MMPMMQEQGVEYNPHTSVTFQDLSSQFDDYEKLLKPRIAFGVSGISWLEVRQPLD